MSSNPALYQDTVLTMIADEVLPLAPNGLTLLKLEGDVLSELRVDNISIEEIVIWIDNLVSPVFIYDVSVYESYLVEKYLVDGDRLILFTFDYT